VVEVHQRFVRRVEGEADDTADDDVVIAACVYGFDHAVEVGQRAG